MVTRRSLLKNAAALGAAGTWGGRAAALSSARDRPNVLLIITDQQNWQMMGCAGNRWLKTPAMDSLAESGTRFDLAYTTNPVCAPARFSLQTGRMPSAANINNNDDGVWGQIPNSVLETSLGPLFHQAGYDTVYGGKIHLPHIFRDEFAGRSYRYLVQDEREGLAKTCADYLKQSHDRPFFLTASLINPHDICYVAINAYRNSIGQPPMSDEVDTTSELQRQARAKDWPPLPANHAIPLLEPAAVTEKYLKPMPVYGPYRAWVREHWTDDDWRIHSWIYHRLTELVDRQIQIILMALRDSNLERNTLVVFTSDHGELNGAHKLEHKEVLYEEAMRVPFIMSYPGVIPQGRADKTHLVSNGLDLLPTLCDYAGIQIPPAALDGRSLRPLLESVSPKDWRDYVVVESEHDRTIRTARYKYCRYTSGLHAEQLNDLVADPGEMNNLAEDPNHAGVLKTHQDLLNRWMYRTWDYE